MGPIKVGDRLLHARNPWREKDPVFTEWIRVTKVGRTWAHFCFEDRPNWNPRGSQNRFDLETLRLCGGQFTSPGRVYRDEAHMEEVERANELWKAFRKEAFERGYNRPEHLTSIDILKAADALKIRLKEE